MDRAQSEQTLPAFFELLGALPPSARLWIGSGTQIWTESTPADAAAQLGLPYIGRTFSDIENSPYAYEIETLASYYLLSGYGDGTFRPEQTITRAEFCTMLAAALNLPFSSSALSFSDSAAGAWYIPYVSAMLDRGFIDGYEDNTYRPQAAIT